MRVAVNLSMHQLRQDDLVPRIRRALDTHRVDPALLTFEITESVAMEDTQATMRSFGHLARIGASLSIDDFGTGYSSLGRLRELPIHEVKIDKSFVLRSGADHRDRAVVRSAVQLGHALDLEVVAEGVEDAETYAYLAQEGCDVVQGYYLSQPLPPDEFLEWVINHETSLILSASQE